MRLSPVQLSPDSVRCVSHLWSGVRLSPVQLSPGGASLRRASGSVDRPRVSDVVSSALLAPPRPMPVTGRAEPAVAAGLDGTHRATPGLLPTALTPLLPGGFRAEGSLQTADSGCRQVNCRTNTGDNNNEHFVHTLHGPCSETTDASHKYDVVRCRVRQELQ